jgi:hypothetical protein
MTHAGHEHDRQCYWDHMQCGWVCLPRPLAESPISEDVVEERPAAPPAERSLAVIR